ncbi:hypothetical protein V5O48_001060 [Marasmius crinis-equi]|uniref:Endonuclease/exonuclease/phosphatase domain-containing protein n=1 Tax=Marasmius crinis-equi TaxID=585013 RepID=A0ABR3FZJ7_9AGAR
MSMVHPSIGTSEEEEIFIPPLEGYEDLDDTPDPSPIEPTYPQATSFRSTTPRGRTPTPATYPKVATPDHHATGPTSEPCQVYRQWPLRLQHFKKSKQEWCAAPTKPREKGKVAPKTLALATWNIDFMSHYPQQRVRAALDELRDHILPIDKKTKALKPCVVLLQEVHATMLEVIRSCPWVQGNFYVTPLNHLKWPNPHTYGNVTLVHRSLQVDQAFLLEYRLSPSSRSAIMIDVKLHSDKVLRIANTHLESMDMNVRRQEQLGMCARYCWGEGIDGGVIAGDLNAIDPDWETQVEQAGMEDAFQEGRHDRPEEGFTWGYQCNTEADKQYPRGRLDRILFTPETGFEVTRPVVVGKGARDAGGRFISDHYGLAADIHVQA